MAFTATTVNSAGAWRPDIYTFAAADVIPDALILQCSTVAGPVEGDQPVVRVAYVDDDTAQFSVEADLIPEAEPVLAEKLVHTAKVTQLVRLSREQWMQQSTPEQLSGSVSRAVARRANIAFVAEPAPTGPAVAPVAGVYNTSGIVAGAQVSDSLDALVDLVATLESHLATPSHIITDPLGWAELRKLKVGTAFNQSLLGAGTTDATPMLLSLPVLVDPAMTAHTGLVVDKTAIVSAVGTVQVANSEHALFEYDSVLLRATWRFGHVVVRPNRIGKFTVATTPGS